MLANLNYQSLEELDLSGNYFSDIQILNKINLKNLKLLNLSSNNIIDITILNKEKFSGLEYSKSRNSLTPK